MSTCPLCALGTANVHEDFSTDSVKVECPACGVFRMSEEAVEVVRHHSYNKQRWLLSGAIRAANEFGGGSPNLTTDGLPRLIDAANPPRDPMQALDRVILYVKRKASSFAAFVTIGAHEYPLIYGKSPHDMAYVLVTAVQLGLLENPGAGAYRLTPSGWARAAELEASGPMSSQAFVAMWFSPETEAAWQNGLRPGIEEAGYDPIRIDLVQHNEKICDRIILEIRRSHFVVADFTGNRGGVYFEAGFAAGLGLPVIWTCREDFVSKLHFDTRQYNHLVWREPTELRSMVRDRILATLPSGRSVAT